MKKLLALVLGITLCMCCFSTAYAKPSRTYGVTIKVRNYVDKNGNWQDTTTVKFSDAKPFIEGGTNRIMVPVRAIFEEMGYNITAITKNGLTDQAVIFKQFSNSKKSKAYFENNNQVMRGIDLMRKLENGKKVTQFNLNSYRMSHSPDGWAIKIVDNIKVDDILYKHKDGGIETRLHIGSSVLETSLYGRNKIDDENAEIDAIECNYEADAKAQIIDNRTYIPLRAAAECLGLDVSWDAKTKTAIISA